MRKEAGKKKSGRQLNAERQLARKAKEELVLRRDIAQKAVDVSNFLGIHGFLTARQSRSMADKILKYIQKYKLGLVDKSWKDYLVLLPGSRVHPKWKILIPLTPSTTEKVETRAKASTRRA